MSSPLLPKNTDSRPNSRSSMSSTLGRPAPLVLHPANAAPEAEGNENADPFATAGGSGKPSSTAAAAAASNIPRKPRASLSGPPPAAKDIIHRGVGSGAGGSDAGAAAGGGAHMKRLSTGSLRGEGMAQAARMENLELRVRNYKMDCIGLAKDILGLCEESAGAKGWIKEIALALDNVCRESKDTRARVDELVAVFEQVATQLKELHEAKDDKAAVKSTVEWQSLIIQDLLDDKKQREQVRVERKKDDERRDGILKELVERDERRDAELDRLSALLAQSSLPQPSSAPAHSSPGEDVMHSLLGRIAELERSFADSTFRISSPPGSDDASRPKKLSAASGTSADPHDATQQHQLREQRDRDRDRKFEKELERGRREAKEKEARMQALLGEALERNLVLAARVRELETSKNTSSSTPTVPLPPTAAAAVEAAAAFGLVPAGEQGSIADSLFSAAGTPALPRVRTIKEAQTPAPTLPALDPMSPFVLDRTVRRGERHAGGLARGRGSSLRE